MTQQGPSAQHGPTAPGDPPARPFVPALAGPASQLSRISSPADLRSMSTEQLATLAGEIREFLVEQTSKRGGHLGPNLGVVELTIALHLVFDSPRDPIVFDTGHQAYVHKIITGRADRFGALRTRRGLSGYPNRAESEHDWIENSHASTSLSYADGLAKAFALRKERDRTVVAVIGDGALTGGMAWEALNNIAGCAGPSTGDRAQRQRPVLRADHRRHGAAYGRAAAPPRLRTDAGAGEEHPATGAGGRSPAVLGAARREVRRQGLVPAADDVRRPRPEVRRTDRRARHRGAAAGPEPGQGLPGAGARPLRDAQGPGLPARRVRRRRADALPARFRPDNR